MKIQKQGITFRKALSVEKRVAVAMWRLASGNSYRTINEVFGTGKSPVIKLVQEFFMKSPEYTSIHKVSAKIEKCNTAFKDIY